MNFNKCRKMSDGQALIDDEMLDNITWESDIGEAVDPPTVEEKESSDDECNPYDLVYRTMPDESVETSRIFQRFWAGNQDDCPQQECLPKPDNYGMRKRRKSRPKLFEYYRFFEDDPPSSKPVHYAPKRPPPILDFAFVLTSFIVAVVMAYYSAT